MPRATVYFRENSLKNNLTNTDGVQETGTSSGECSLLSANLVFAFVTPLKDNLDLLTC
jgi:hypothetical protein